VGEFTEWDRLRGGKGTGIVRVTGRVSLVRVAACSLSIKLSKLEYANMNSLNRILSFICYFSHLSPSLLLFFGALVSLPDIGAG
jgi:hypothetical protein